MDVETGMESLDRAVAGRLPVLLLAVTDGDAAEIPAKFVGTQDDGEVRGLWVQPINAADGRQLERLAKDKATVRATFLDNGARLTFAAVVEKRNRAYWMNDTTAVEAALLRWPEEVTSPEMRVARRYRVSDTNGRVYGRLFFRHATGTREVPDASLWDISSGGISFVCPVDKQYPAQRGDLFVAVVHYHGKQLMLPARFTHARAFSSRAMRMGFRFDLENPMLDNAREDLTHVCQSLEEAEARTMKGANAREGAAA
jgi:hypothetical protein